MKKQWQLHAPNEQLIRRLVREIGCHPLIARLLAIRGMQTREQAETFLNPSLGHLASPFTLTGMERAVQRIHRALKANEKMVVYGDYDADGVTATAVLVSFLRQCGARVDYCIPHRISQGYGLGPDFITQRAHPDNVGLIITVDCGSSSHEAITLARDLGIDTIVTDHHPADRVPEAAVAVVNPARADCHADLAYLAGVGVAFYLVVALRAHLRTKGFWNHRSEPNLKQLCDLVALGTVADVAPLIHENRSLTAAGLYQINQGLRPGLRALMRLSGAPAAAADAETIAFKLAPRINAAGRIAHARMACELLLAEDQGRANRLAAALGRLNSRRQSMESDLLQSILMRLERRPDLAIRPVLVIHGKRWHEGILGIVAARLTRQFDRPAVVLTRRNGIAKGSARSVEGIDIAAALGQCEELLDRFGGHPLAAGLALPSSSLDDFESRLTQAVNRLAAQTDTEVRLSIDARLPVDRLTPALMDGIERLGPFGQDNPYPLFMDTGIRVHECRTVGGNHRRMVLRQVSLPDNLRLDAIQFNIDPDAVLPDSFERVAYEVQWNRWNGNVRPQLVITAIQL